MEDDVIARLQSQLTTGHASHIRANGSAEIPECASGEGDVIRGLKNDLRNREISKRIINVQIQSVSGIVPRQHSATARAVGTGRVQNNVIRIQQ